MKKNLSLSIIFAALAFSAMAQEVSPSGAFNYSVPIEVPPGTGGIQPNLSLNYNSQGGNGFLGMGWSLGGLSVITRDTSYDVTWNDSTDHFVYNGQKLIPDNSNPVLQNTFYTENYNGQRIRVVRDGNGVIQTWEVTQKDGTRMIYGMRQDLPNGDDADSDGYIAAVDKNGAARLWALRQVIDVNGNYYLVSYKEDTEGGDYYPERIVYTRNSLIDNDNNARYKAVIFGYGTDRQDHDVKYIPSKVDMNERMVSVEVRIGTGVDGSGGSLVRSYALEYDADLVLGTSRLVSVQEFGSNGGAKPKTVFEWGDIVDSLIEGIFNTFKSQVLDSPNNFYNLHTGDFNGDGKTDLLRTSQYPEKNHLWLSTGEGFQDMGNFFPNDVIEDYYGSRNIFLGDFNGDGKTDILHTCEDSSKNG
ncbi:MAG: VCBS repeat-containing protein, partial [Spirochaetales bacterium]|nr:VCBS repeat-containing protein [Spirochaetales bacterium]